MGCPTATARTRTRRTEYWNLHHSGCMNARSWVSATTRRATRPDCASWSARRICLLRMPRWAYPAVPSTVPAANLQALRTSWSIKCLRRYGAGTPRRHLPRWARRSTPTRPMTGRSTCSPVRRAEPAALTGHWVLCCAWFRVCTSRLTRSEGNGASSVRRSAWERMIRGRCAPICCSGRCTVPTRSGAISAGLRHRSGASRQRYCILPFPPATIGAA